jgi:hypothetical protein
MFPILQLLIGGWMPRKHPWANLPNKPNIGIPQPRRLGDTVVTEGDCNHKHTYEIVEWDSERFGSEITNMDHDLGVGTWHDLFRCPCGREVVREERAAI